MSNRTRTKTIKISSEHHEIMKKLAIETGISLEECVERALTMFCEECEKEYKGSMELKMKYYEDKAKEGGKLAGIILGRNGLKMKEMEKMKDRKEEGKKGENKI